MEKVEATKTVYTVSQFLDWQRAESLNLNPIFQRRPVWKAPAKSLFIDSIVRGYPVPIILLRQVQDLETLSITMEVVDGQQRLRTLLAFIDPDCLRDYDEETDHFTVRAIHNREVAGKPFSKLPTESKQALLSYELSTHVFPSTTGDELVFRIFARLNSTGLSLNKQEIRNSEFHGAFKTLVYELSFQYLDYWRRWRVFSNDAIARMLEAEAVSEYLLAMINGVEGKSQAKITKFYRDHEEDLVEAEVLRRRFEVCMAAIDERVGAALPTSAFRRPALFYSLFAAIYDHIYRLKSSLDRTRPKTLPTGLQRALRIASARIKTKDLPENVQDAMDKATTDKARRDVRHRFIMKALGLESAS